MWGTKLLVIVPAFAIVLLHARRVRGTSDYHTVYVVSNRRSGTHMTMNLMRNRYEKIRACKTNHMTVFEVSCSCIEWMRKTGTIVHAERDVSAMIQSQFYYHKLFKSKYGIQKSTTMSQYAQMQGAIDELVQIWYNTVQWKHVPNVTTLHFEETASENYTRADFLGFKRRAVMGVHREGVAVGAGLGLSPVNREIVAATRRAQKKAVKTKYHPKTPCQPVPCPWIMADCVT